MATGVMAFFLLLNGMERVEREALIERYSLLKPYFKKAYELAPSLPYGILEAMSFTITHMRNIQPDREEASCIGLPGYWGPMGLIMDGKGFFIENGKLIAQISGFDEEAIKRNPAKNIIATAIALEHFFQKIKNGSITGKMYEALKSIHYIPGGTNILEYARDAEIYQIFSLLADEEFMGLIGQAPHKIDWSVFGRNESVLKARQVKIIKQIDRVETENGYYLMQTCTNPPDYPQASWVPADPNNYSNGRNCAISAITIHTTQGSYSGTIAWFQNPSAQVSAHYVLRSSDGAVTQMVCEIDKAWHVGTENCYTIGYEHEGWVNDPSWYTMAMYTSSANIAKYDVQRWGIPAHRTCFWDWAAVSTTLVLGNCTRIKGHQHYPNQTHTDPGQYWNWDLYFKLINDNPQVITYTQPSGSIYDSGGPSGNYGDDERKVYVISPQGASSVTITFTQFAVEQNWDYLYVYDGNSVWAPLLGKYTGNTLPPQLTSSGPSITIEFRSDCATNDAGYAISWTSTLADTVPPITQIFPEVNPYGWQNSSFYVSFSDTDNAGSVAGRFWQVAEYRNNGWYCNPVHGFFNDEFTSPQIDTQWTTYTGTWTLSNSTLYQNDESVNNTNIYAFCTQNASSEYLYSFRAAFTGGTSTNRRLGIHIFADSATAYNRWNSYLIWFRYDNAKFQLYKIVNDSLNLVNEVPLSFSLNVWYEYKIYYNPQNGVIKIWRNNSLISQWQDPNPIQSGKFISLRTGNALAGFKEVRVLKSRGPDAVVIVGNPNGMVRFENPSKNQPSCRILSRVVDASGNWSQLATSYVNIDWTTPYTQIQAPSGWQTSTFNVSFKDTDNLSGVWQKFWNVSEFRDGNWYCNRDYGFFNDLFQSPQIDTQWTPYTGTWTINAGMLSQTDENVTNTNIYSYLKQDSTHAYLYVFSARFDGGTSTNRRLGIHIFADSATAFHRWNSYLIWFRLDNAKFQLYRVKNDTLNLVVEKPLTTQLNTLYHYRIYYNPQSGKLIVWRNTQLIAEWTDPQPIKSGKYISLRTGNALASYGYVRVYKSRGGNEQVTVGTGGMVRYENPSPQQPSCRLLAFSIDTAYNFLIGKQDTAFINIDWTPPLPSTVYDTSGFDVDTVIFTGQSSIMISWLPFKDTNSGIKDYYAGAAYTPGIPSITGWNYASLDTFYLFNLSQLPYDTLIYTCVKAENNAGFSSIACSDGFIIIQLPTGNPPPLFSLSDTPRHGKLRLLIYDQYGKLLYSSLNMNSLPGLPQGIYTAIFIEETPIRQIRFFKRLIIIDKNPGTFNLNDLK